MRRVTVVVLSFITGCVGGATGPSAPLPSGRYTLTSVDQKSLPVRLDEPGQAEQIVAGSLSLEPNGYFVLAESDTIGVGHALVRYDRADGGTWTADGAMLTLSDTAVESRDDYGSATSTYLGWVAPHTIWLTLGEGDGRTSHVYRFDQ